jgi:hypothetical protein
MVQSGGICCPIYRLRSGSGSRARMGALLYLLGRGSVVKKRVYGERE